MPFLLSLMLLLFGSSAPPAVVVTGPANIDAAHAVDLGALPATYTQNVRVDGSTWTVWVSFLAIKNVTGIFGFGDLVGYFPTARVYAGPVAAPVQVLAIAGENRAIQVPTTPGVRYYVELTTNSAVVTPASLTVAVESAPDAAAQAGDFFLIADALGHPSAVIQPDTDFRVRRFVSPFPFDSDASSAANLADGTMLVTDEANTRVALYDGAFAFVMAPAIVLTTRFPVIGANRTLNKFAVASTVNPTLVSIVSAAGTVESTHSVTGAMAALCPSNDGTILYYSRGSIGAGFAVKRWDLVNDLPLSDLVAGVVGYFLYDILALDDGSVLVAYASLGAIVARDFVVRRYSAAGALVQTYSFGSTYVGAVPRIQYGPDFTTTFGFWGHILSDADIGQNNPVYSVLKLLSLSTGAVLSSKQSVEYDELDGANDQDGVYGYAMTATPLGRFGNSNSCPFLVLPTGPPEPAAHVCADSVPSVSCWNGFTGAELQIRRVAQ